MDVRFPVPGGAGHDNERNAMFFDTQLAIAAAAAREAEAQRAIAKENEQH